MNEDRQRIFLMVATTVWLLLHLYLGWRLVAPLATRPWIRWVGFAMLAASFVLSLGAFIIGRVWLHGLGAHILHWGGYLSMGIVLTLLPLVLVRDLSWLVLTGIEAVINMMSEHRPLHLVLQNPSRRDFLMNATGGLFAFSAASLGALGYQQARKLAKTVHVPVYFENLHPDLEGFRIVQVTDIHVGPTIRKDYLQPIVDQVNALHADFVAITGDLVDGFVHDLHPHVAPLADLRATHGAYFVTGNHEYYWGAQDWIDYLSSIGIRTLINEHVVLQRDRAELVLAGVTDFTAGSMLPSHRSDPVRALQHSPATALKVLLAHQPKTIPSAVAAGFDLQLSGHTHGGQFFPWNWAVQLVHPLAAGLKRFDQMWAYVSRGTGYWGPPMRSMAPSEITLITLHRAQATTTPTTAPTATTVTPS
jgi:predicted MPP superfamily phosphohydrolase